MAPHHTNLRRRTLFSWIKFLGSGLWALPLLMIARATHSFQVGTLEVNRIGHFAADGIDHFLRADDGPKRIYWWGPTCNAQWDKMLRQKLKVRRWVKWLYLWNKVIPGGGQLEVPIAWNPLSRDVTGTWQERSQRPEFLPDEDREVQSWLSSLGWMPGQPLVCLHVRDDFYLRNRDASATTDWTYHRYRNSDIQTYAAACSWLIGQGVFLIRMGQSDKPLTLNTQVNFFDYAISDQRTHLRDVWLFTRCTACISTASGPDNLAMAYDRPLLMINALPWAHLTGYANTMWAPKVLWSLKDARKLTVEEALNISHVTTRAYEESGVGFQDLDEFTITAIVQEFWRDFVMAKSLPQLTSLQESFDAAFKAYSKGQQIHGYRHPRFRVSNVWLKSLHSPIQPGRSSGLRPSEEPHECESLAKE